jgi:uncharacterized protein (TIGR03000 family)
MRCSPCSWRRLLLFGLAVTLVSSAGSLAAGQEPNTAWVLVKLPPGAERATIKFGDYLTKSTGLERWYSTPPLAPGKTYSYEVTAEWSVRGKEFKYKEKASVAAGKETTVDFTKVVPGDKKDDTKKDDTKKKDDAKKDDTKKKDDGKVKTAPQRSFLFTYSTKLTGLTPGKAVKIWIPLPQSSPEQEVRLEKEAFPGKSSIAAEPLYGNKMLFLEAEADKSGTVAVTLTFKVTRQEVKTAAGFRKQGESEKMARFLQPDKLGPITGKPLELIKDKQLGKTQMETAKLFYDVVNGHMTYSKKGVGWGLGDVVWACDSKYGNCSDFHSIFIALARSQKIPAKFEVGFPIPGKRGEGTIGGCHCWAWFLPDGKGWVPVDISEANQHPEMMEYFFGNLTADRVAFTTGRDIDLVPRQSGPALNYFIYPYAEVEGTPVPEAQIKNSFSYRDINP